MSETREKPEDRLNRAIEVRKMLVSPGGAVLLEYLKDRMETIQATIFSDSCRQQRAYEVFAGRGNEVKDMLFYLTEAIPEDGERAAKELKATEEKGAAHV